MKKMIWNFIKEEDGLELSEYAVMGALIILIILASIQALSGAISGALQGVADVITGGGGDAGGV